MKIIVIPDSFKGSLTSLDAAAAMERGLISALDNPEVVCLPVADGGEGTIDVFESISFGRTLYKHVTGPMGDQVQAKYILAQDGSAVVEMAQASGLTLVDSAKRNPLRATTYGTGELIADAVRNGARKILLAIGGSATNDGGTGLAQALGASYRNVREEEIGPGCAGLEELCSIEESGMCSLLKGVEIVIASDVQNTLCGPQGASAVYGPQKGADAQMVRQMDGLLSKLADVIMHKTGTDMRAVPGTGAAGGIAVPLLAFAGAKLVSGIETILQYTGFEKLIEGADYVLTGEGKIDEQTPYGKTIAGIAAIAKSKNVPVIAFAGMLGKGYDGVFETGVKSCFCILPGVMTLEDAMENAPAYLEDCVRRVARLL